MVTNFNLVKNHGHNIPLTKFIYAKLFSNTSPFELLKVKQMCGSLYQHPLIVYVAFMVRWCTGELAPLASRQRPPPRNRA